jgi:hypothetical protein
VREFRGFCVLEFEGVAFFEGDVRPVSPASSLTSLAYDDASEATALRDLRRVCWSQAQGGAHLCRIRLIGAEAPELPNRYGHRGWASREILIDRVLEIEDLGLYAKTDNRS